MNAAHELMKQSFHFVQPSEAVKNALAYSYARRDAKANDYLSKKHQRPSLIDKAKNYFLAII